MDDPIPKDVGIDLNHIGDGWSEIVELPSASDVNLLPSAKDAMIPDVT